MNARMGERSSVPPSGGMMPRNRFRYGSQIVLRARRGGRGVGSGEAACVAGYSNSRSTATVQQQPRYSTTHASGLEICSGTDGNQVSTRRRMSAAL
jgi:hypothetical protein